MLCNRSVPQMSDVYTVCAFPVPKANRKLPKNSCIYTRKRRDISLIGSIPVTIFGKYKSVDGAYSYCQPKAITPTLPGRI